MTRTLVGLASVEIGSAADASRAGSRAVPRNSRPSEARRRVAGPLRHERDRTTMRDGRGSSNAARGGLRILGAPSVPREGRGDERATGQRVSQSGDEVGGKPTLDDIPEGAGLEGRSDVIGIA